MKRRRSARDGNPVAHGSAQGGGGVTKAGDSHAGS
jgi:hypothetical protein